MAALLSTEVYALDDASLDALGDADNVDTYADLEQWYAASQSHLRSPASGAPLTDVFTSRQPLVPSDASTSAAETTDVDQRVDDDTIDLDAEERLVSEASTPSQPPVTLSSLGEETLDDDPFLHFVPKQRGKAPRGGEMASAAQRCCDTCRSDLNGKLLVKCATCAFRRHLYCFAPPRREHPALTGLHHVPRHKRLPIALLVAHWRCDACVTRLGSAPSPEHTQLLQAKPQTAPRKFRTAQKKKAGSSPKSISNPTQLRTEAFDWYVFRANKLTKVESHFREEDESPTLQNELAYFSPSRALLRKTACFWQQHVHRRAQQRAQYVARLRKCQQPLKLMLSVELSPREAAEVAASNKLRQDQEEVTHRALFDDTTRYPFNDPRPVFETLRWRPPPQVIVDESDGLTEEARHTRETEECLWMEREDDDAPTPAQAERLARRRAFAAVVASDPSLLGLCLAARIIDRVGFRWLGSTRRRVRETTDTAAANATEAVLRAKEEREQRLAEEREQTRMGEEELTQRKRRKRAQQHIERLGFVIRFLLAMVRAQRRVHVKKTLVTLLTDAKEDSEFLHSRDVEQLARRRLERFFCRRVRRYLHLKTRVMVRRIVHWWKRRFYTHHFRILAIGARLKHREKAARRIQRTFRAYHVYHRFQSFREQLALRRLKQFLRGWLLLRLATKERERIAAFNAAIAITGVVNLVSTTAPLHAILKAVGLALYEQSDFQNASAVLTRLARFHPESMDGDTQFVLAYSHHQSWYTTRDPFQLAQAKKIYASLLPSTQTSGLPLDPFILQELAIVLMHREAFRASLSLLATLIQLFRTDDSFPLWLLLAGVQLAQLGDYDQSVAYLGYVVDLALPSPYLERDVLALCAMSYEKAGDGDHAMAAKEAWRAAVRLWTMEKKMGGTVGSPISVLGSPTQSDGHSQLSTVRKWEMLLDLAQRVTAAGHYVVACRSLLYALERLAPVIDVTERDATFMREKRRAWSLLADAFRHLGRLELFVEATARSRETETASGEAERLQWREMAENERHRFEKKLRTLSPAALILQIQQQYEATVSRVENDLQLEDIVTG